MARTLTAARVSVRAGREDEYLALLQQRQAAATRAGFRFWVFQNRDRPGQFLEFTESAEGLTPEADAELEARTRAIAYYASDASDVWTGVELPSA
jgi:hypothetical protein